MKELLYWRFLSKPLSLSGGSKLVQFLYNKNKERSNTKQDLYPLVLLIDLGPLVEPHLKNEAMSSQGNVSPRIGEEWRNVLQEEFEASYFSQLKDFLVEEKRRYTIYPPGDRIFAAFDRTPFSKVRVVILGQDPYHGPGQANGLCFSVFDGVKHPPSLVNILKELEDDMGVPYPRSGDLSKWADQGVLLLNATLTVRKGEAGAHRGQGWEKFTDAVVRALSERKKGLVFLLWGKQAQQKGRYVDPFAHHILEAPHPSPFSAHKGFFGCRHFSKTNELLREEGCDPIDWDLDHDRVPS